MDVQTPLGGSTESAIFQEPLNRRKLNCVRQLSTQDKAKEIDLGLHKKNARNRHEDLGSILFFTKMVVSISNRSANTDGTLKERPESSSNFSLFSVLSFMNLVQTQPSLVLLYGT